MFAFTTSSTAQQTTHFALNQADVIATSNQLTDDEENYPRVNEYRDMPLMEWDANWWMNLEQEISLENESYKHLSGESLQNAIFFLANHNERINLASSAPVLLDVYLYNKSEEKRIMALAALTLIGDKESLEAAERMLYRQRSERVMNFSIAALTAYKTNQMSVQLAMDNK